eukprot:370863_1
MQYSTPTTASNVWPQQQSQLRIPQSRVPMTSRADWAAHVKRVNQVGTPNAGRGRVVQRQIASAGTWPVVRRQTPLVPGLHMMAGGRGYSFSQLPAARGGSLSRHLRTSQFGRSVRPGHPASARKQSIMETIRERCLAQNAAAAEKQMSELSEKPTVMELSDVEFESDSGSDQDAAASDDVSGILPDPLANFSRPQFSPPNSDEELGVLGPGADGNDEILRFSELRKPKKTSSRECMRLKESAGEPEKVDLESLGVERNENVFEKADSGEFDSARPTGTYTV